MGFRSRRRHRGSSDRPQGGGEHGGGGHGGHSFHGGEPNGVQPGDDVGNRKSTKPVFHPPDDIGNRKDPDEGEWVPEENVGNRIDIAPTHEISGTLMDADPKRRRRRPKGMSVPERVGRYLIGGVNPLIASATPRPFPNAERANDDVEAEPGVDSGRFARPANDDNAGGFGYDGPPADDQEGGRGRRRRDRGHVETAVHADVAERRAQRFFDFEDDDRFDYTLKSTPEAKRQEAHDAVNRIVQEAGRDATVDVRVLPDGTRPKILVTIDERGPSADVPAERRSPTAQEALFQMGNAALTSLNYLVNKIVNRYPDDRIRLAILPKADERLYLDALVEHQAKRGVGPAPAAVPVVVPAAVAAPTPVVPVAPVVAGPPVVMAAPAPAPVVAGFARAAPAPVATAPMVKDVDEAADAAPAKKARVKKRTEPEPEPAADKKPRRAVKKADDGPPARAVKRPVKKAAAVEVVKAAPKKK